MAGLGRRVVMGDHGELPEQAADELRPIARPHRRGPERRGSAGWRGWRGRSRSRSFPVWCWRAEPTRPSSAPPWRWRPTAQRCGGACLAWCSPAMSAMASVPRRGHARRGASVETLYLDLLAPTARHLGDLWDADVCDFTEVTVGLGRLQQVLHELSPAFQSEIAQPRARPARPAGARARASSTRSGSSWWPSSSAGPAGTYRTSSVETRQDLVRTVRDRVVRRGRPLGRLRAPASMPWRPASGPSAGRRATAASASWSAGRCSSTIPSSWPVSVPTPPPAMRGRRRSRRRACCACWPGPAESRHRDNLSGMRGRKRRLTRAGGPTLFIQQRSWIRGGCRLV